MTAPICPAIDVGLYLETTGAIKTCCAGKGPLGNIKEQSLQEIFFHSKKFLDSRQALQAQQFPEYCVDCVRVESVTPGQSQYFDFQRKFTSDGTRRLKHIDLRWSNICNLNCRYCNHQYSSSWEKLQGIKPQSVQRDYHASILEEVKQSYDSVEVVHLLGGEPLLQKQNEELIQSLREDVEIIVFTNLSTSLENNAIYNLLKQKTNVRWYISFENVGDKFEYVRAGASWDKLVHNLNLLKDEGQYICVIPVYSIWSATNLLEYYDFLAEYPIRSRYWRYAQAWGGPFGTDVIIPDGYNDEFRHRAIEQIDLVDQKYGADQALLDIKRHLEKDTPKPGQIQKFLDWTARIEGVVPTPKPFRELWPEIYTSFTE